MRNLSLKLKKECSDLDQLLFGLDQNVRFSQNAEKNET